MSAYRYVACSFTAPSRRVISSVFGTTCPSLMAHAGASTPSMAASSSSFADTEPSPSSVRPVLLDEPTADYLQLDGSAPDDSLLVPWSTRACRHPWSDYGTPLPCTPVSDVALI